MYQQEEDEISLVDIWLILIKQKKIIFRVLLAFVVLGSLYALLKPEIYTFSTTVQVGTLISGDKEAAIESADNALTKIKSAYIPFILSQHYDQHPENKDQYKIEASVPKGSEMIVIESKGRESEEPVFKQLIKTIVEKLITDHAGIIDVKIRNMEVSIARAENVLAGSKDSAKLITANVQRLKQTDELLRRQLGEKKVFLANLVKNRSNIQNNSASGAMNILLIDSEIQRYQKLIDDLEKHLIIDLSQQQAELEKAGADNLREQSDQQNNIDQLKNQLANISYTKAIIPVMKSIEPIGIGKAAIIVIATVLGFFAGIFAAFFMVFVDKVKKEADVSS
ncbi:MAG: Wzz/FepE/Etk N-terminal domain-containing protein [Methylococcaceae bacterium]